ncbi:RHS repeat domain-containing protein [Methanosarcina sp. 2.H.A.1B.4]|uniref:RHS repeat domain-containing protein n=1 Tax=Methanosarcina sp. 2.H.A.1B.4 TaxID=1483600 RepID=UPI000B0394A4|nr:RHS repeat-associated core domain-containing protein [Methanosarcina sp. 2.H.A.1B.4]
MNDNGAKISLMDNLWHHPILLKLIFFTYYINKFYEIDNGTSTSYFFRDDERVAKETSEGMEWYLSDHIGSTSLMVDETGHEVERTDYFPYGQVRSGGLEKYGFTGQENDDDTGLMYYGARYYSPEYRVFVQPDTLLPDPYNPQALNRYSYALNNPVKYTDPSGHIVDTALDAAFILMDLNDIRQDPSDLWAWGALGADGVCAVVPFATGGGLGVKGIKAANEIDNAVDAEKAVTNTEELVKTVDNGLDAVDNVKWLDHAHKHMASSKLPWKDVVKGTKHGSAKYVQDFNDNDIKELETMVWKEGTKVEQNGKTYSVMKFDDVIGASSGQETQYVQVEYSDGFIHGRPIDESRYNKLLKDDSLK